MTNSTEAEKKQKEGGSFEEQFLRHLIKNYEDSFNQFNEKYDIRFDVTVTTHTGIATPDGNKDFAYLRINKFIRNKGGQEAEEMFLVHQEVYPFRDIKERINPNQKWKETLFLNAMARLVAGGLEYAEFLRRARKVQENQVKDQDPKEIIVTKEMPQPLTKSDEEYKEWLKAERAKEGLST